MNSQIFGRRLLRLLSETIWRSKNQKLPRYARVWLFSQIRSTYIDMPIFCFAASLRTKLCPKYNPTNLCTIFVWVEMVYYQYCASATILNLIHNEDNLRQAWHQTQIKYRQWLIYFLENCSFGHQMITIGSFHIIYERAFKQRIFGF